MLMVKQIQYVILTLCTFSSDILFVKRYLKIYVEKAKKTVRPIKSLKTQHSRFCHNLLQGLVRIFLVIILLKKSIEVFTNKTIDLENYN